MNRSSQAIAGANAGRSRVHNRRLVLGQMRAEGTIGRAELARRSGLSTQAVSNIIAELESEGLIRSVGTRSAGRGLPAVQYTVCADGAFALGYEIRPDAAFVSLMGIDGRERFSKRHALHSATPKNVCTALVSLQNEALAATGVDHQRLLGAGVVMPGPIEKTGVAGQGSELPQWQAVRPKDLLEDGLGLSVEVENDANAAAMAERVAGVARNLSHYVFLYFGTGLGLGIVSNGRLEKGRFGNAGEIGHIPICVDGAEVPLESAVSRMSLRTHMARSGQVIGDSDDLTRLFAARNPAFLDWLAGAARALGPTIQIIENLFDPETIVMGGAIPDLVLDYIVASVDLPDRSVANRADRTAPRLQRGGSGRMTAPRGAAALVLNRTFTPQFERASQ